MIALEHRSILEARPATPRPESRMCITDVGAFLAGEKHSDAPQCACSVIAAVVRAWNDGISDDETRTRVLRPLLPKLIGSRVQSDAVLLRRMYLVIDWHVRTYAPAFLRVGGFEAHAVALENLPEIVDGATLRPLHPTLLARPGARPRARPGARPWRAARRRGSGAAWSAAWSAARRARPGARPVSRGLRGDRAGRGQERGQERGRERGP